MCVVVWTLMILSSETCFLHLSWCARKSVNAPALHFISFTMTLYLLLVCLKKIRSACVSAQTLCLLTVVKIKSHFMTSLCRKWNSYLTYREIVVTWIVFKKERKDTQQEKIYTKQNPKHLGTKKLKIDNIQCELECSSFRSWSNMH